MFRSAGVRMLFVLSLLFPALAGSRAEGEIRLPFNANQTWYVCQGYLSTTSGTHNNTHALDLTLDPNGIGTAGCLGDQNYSAGEEVLAPGRGTVTHWDYQMQTCPPQDDDEVCDEVCDCECIQVWTRDLICLDLEQGGSLKIGHLDPDSRVPEGPVEAGEVLGVLAVQSDRCSDDEVFNGEYAHIHIAAYGSNDCSGDSTPFTGAYSFHGAPDLPDMSTRSSLPDFRNHWFGTGLSNLEVQASSDDAGHRGTDCGEGNGFNEVYFGRCPSGAAIVSGFRFEDLPVGGGTYISSAALVLTTDGPYSSLLNVEISAEKSGQAQPFTGINMPSARSNRTSSPQVWRIHTLWALGGVVQTPELRSTLQQVVNLPFWLRSSNSVAFLTRPMGSSGTSHRRVTAWERAQLTPDLLPPRLVVTQFRTLSPLNVWKGNNPPAAAAGPDQLYSAAGTRIDLDGRKSFDPDGEAVTYHWEKIDGPPVTLNGENTSTPWFVTGPVADAYVFELTVTDNGWGKLLSRDTVRVTCTGCQ